MTQAKLRPLAQLFMRSAFRFVLCAATAVCVQAQDSKQGTDESWTATAKSFMPNFNPSRTIESHAKSGNRTIDKQRFEVLGVNGGYRSFSETAGYVDIKKLGITGESYGGYMTLMAAGKTADVWAAAVEEYGIINWITMLEHEDPVLQQYEQTLLGSPVKDRKVYEDASPIKYLANARAPLLVLQGENDIRVPKEEPEQVVKILKDANKTVDVYYYANEGHGFSKRENQIDSIQTHDRVVRSLSKDWLALTGCPLRKTSAVPGRR